MPRSTNAIVRVDKFDVPATARDSFIARVGETHAILDTLDGCLENLVLEQVAGDGVFNIVTVVKWRDEAAYEAARETMRARREASGFNPQKTFAELGIRADLGNYRIVPIAAAPDD
ncbi:antibiotic biosynthesis monooxygenase family protein [Amorphus orientalis]|uniref:Heme-degrading monooxygenase HmoA n=1 Tax=Amorphus orientalis TaxID=649198 RepID=A0AAE3VPH1_9HYPH|nr:antibiotic biosynthesis monooxygenase family protein [Amorphus orientalis]MDQ0315887.1 heme-degrading monooxygenase HmoA [Amorphus orientalis]